MKKTFLACLMALTACATSAGRIGVDQLQAACKKLPPNFVEHARCLSEATVELAKERPVDRSVQLYSAYAGALSEQVRGGRMGQAEASYRLMALQTRIAAQRQAREDAAYENLLRYTQEMERARRPQTGRSITCSTMWGMTNCSTY